MKARVLALILSVAVAFSGIPATSVSAAPGEYETVIEEVTEELSEEETGTEESVGEESSEEIVFEESVEETSTEDMTGEEISLEVVVEETTEDSSEEENVIGEETVESTEEETTTEESSTEGIVGNTTKKAVGSNGIMYDGFAYLSMKTFNKLSKDAQAAYIQICDSFAKQKEMGLEITDVVISVDKEGNLGVTACVPAQTIFTVSSQDQIIFEENLDLTEQVKAVEEEISDEISAEELGTLLRDAKYFRKQLSDSFSLKIYDLANGAMTGGGRNSISFSYSRLNTSWTPVCDALSALISTYPNRFNWVDWGSGKLTMSIRYGSGGYNYTYTLSKSKHYSSTLESQANKKVKELVNAAYAYAEKSYPNAPTYGIIKYFDTWICKNNYYNNVGVDTKGSGHKKEYFYCHSCYGILLKGYGVCESYALAMTRLLDAAGIRNVYVVGDAGGGHAWNYVEMPDGKWYMVDSTWNDGGSSSNGKYLLCADDGVHKPRGSRWSVGKKFQYPTRSSAAYGAGKADAISMNKSEAVVKPKAAYTLKIDATSNKTNYYKKYKKSWSSSDTKVAKVSSKGKVTAVAPGKAVITCIIAGKKVNSTIYVYQFTGNKFADNSKTSFTWNYANPDTAFTSADAKTFTINVGQKNGTLTATQLAKKLSLDQPKITSNKTSVAVVSNVSLSGDKITFKVTPKAIGSAVITVKFAGKKSTLNVKVTQAIKAAWFDFSEVKNVEYSGKAYKPKVMLSGTGKAISPKLTYKVTYENNKNAGKATVTVTGTGKYGGTVTKNFTINPKDASTATFNKCTASKTYNGKEQAAATTVKLGKTTLKAGVDYDVLYNGAATVPTKAGKYTVTIKTKGNYKATTIKKLVSGATAAYEIKPTTISKVKVTCPKKIKTGNTLSYKVKIGKNELPTGNYTVSFTDKDGKTVKNYTTPGTYKLVITINGSNVEPKKNKDGTKTSTITKTFKVVK